VNSKTERGINISIFLAEGRSDGLKIIELSNWTGVVLSSGLSHSTPLLARAEIRAPGIYLLIGKSEDDRILLYIGESEDVGTRIKQHLQKSVEYWQQAIVATAKDQSLNKAHIKC
jgi:hypothetical protein